MIRMATESATVIKYYFYPGFKKSGIFIFNRQLFSPGIKFLQSLNNKQCLFSANIVIESPAEPFFRISGTCSAVH